MLAALRKGTGSWIAKAFIGLLVLSFAVWGIADIFGGYNRSNVAKVGETEISATDFRRDLQIQIRRMGSRFGRSLTMDEARLLGIDNQVLTALINSAAVENQGKELNLGISDAAIAERIMKEQAFQDATGKFNRAIFEQIIRANGMTEGLFVARQRGTYVREQLTNTVSGNLTVPKILLQATDVYRNQTRKLKYFTLPLSSLEQIKDPSEEALKKFYDSRKQQYTAPELRKIGIIALVPEEVGKKIDISDSDLKTYYDANAGSYKTDELRTIQQIAFPDKAAAQAAYEKIQGGATFEDVAKEAKVTDQDLNLGKLAKADMVDQVIADIAFSLGENEVSKPVEGQLSTVLLRVTKIEPEKVTSFEEAKAGIKTILAKDRAVERILDFYGKIEDERAAGTPLDEIAKQFGIPHRLIDAVDRSGKDRDGNDIEDIPAQRNVLSEAFQSEVGLEIDPVETADQGLVWLDVQEIYPPKLKPFDSIRDTVLSDWREHEERTQLAARGRDIVERASKGEGLEQVAGELELEVKESEALKRSDSSEDLPATAVTQAFALQKGGFGSAASDDGKSRVIFEVVSVTDPEKLGKEAAEALEQQIQPQLATDLVAQYISGLTKKYGVTRNQTLIDELTGASSGNGSSGRGTF